MTKSTRALNYRFHMAYLLTNLTRFYGLKVQYHKDRSLETYFM